MEREISAGLIIYRRTREGPKFLLLYHGGPYWNFPKGKLAQGERNFRAALREVEEETGIGPRDLRFNEWFRTRDSFVYVRDGRKFFKTVTFYLAETRKADIKFKVSSDGQQGEQHQGFGWFLYRDALRLLINQNLKKILKLAYGKIIHRKGLAGGQKNPPRQSLHLPGDRQSHR